MRLKKAYTSYDFRGVRFFFSYGKDLIELKNFWKNDFYESTSYNEDSF